MDKRFDFSVLPNGFLIQRLDSMWIDAKSQGHIDLNLDFRLLMNYWHFNDGSLVLPDGLVVDLDRGNLNGDREIIKGLTCESEIVHYNKDVKYVYEIFHGDAVKIIGAHSDYTNHAKELGIEVIEL